MTRSLLIPYRLPILYNDDPWLLQHRSGRQTIKWQFEEKKSSRGSVIYIYNHKADVLACVNIFDRRNEKSRKADWLAEEINPYLNTTNEYKFVIDKTKPPIFTVYCDSEYTGDRSDRKSTTGTLFKGRNNIFTWSSKEQGCAALSSTEAEFAANLVPRKNYSGF